MYTFLCKSKNGIDVYIDLVESHAATHIKNNPKILNYLKDIVSKHNVLKDEDRFEADMGFEVGNLDLVETNDKDEIIYAKRVNREKYARFVKNKEAAKTNIITVDIRKDNDGKYFIYTAYTGGNTPKVPGGAKEDPDSRDFWRRHALIWGNQEIVAGSETSECPW